MVAWCREFPISVYLSGNPRPLWAAYKIFRQHATDGPRKIYGSNSTIVSILHGSRDSRLFFCTPILRAVQRDHCPLVSVPLVPSFQAGCVHVKISPKMASRGGFFLLGGGGVLALAVEAREAKRGGGRREEPASPFSPFLGLKS